MLIKDSHGDRKIIDLVYASFKTWVEPHDDRQLVITSWDARNGAWHECNLSTEHLVPIACGISADGTDGPSMIGSYISHLRAFQNVYPY